MKYAEELIQAQLVGRTGLSEIRILDGDIIKWAMEKESNFRLEKEANLLLELEGITSCPKVYNTGVELGRRYIRMEYLKGISLENVPPVPSDMQVEMAMALCFTVEDLHCLDYLHCDIKPSNLILTDEGVRVLDFGSVLSLSEAEKKDMRVSFATAGYAPPEVHAGKQWSAQGDIFSLGATLYYICFGEDPFKGEENDEVSLRVCFQDPDPLESPIWPVVENCLQKDLRDRYQTIGQVVDDLTKVANGIDVKSRTPSERTIRRRRRSVGTTRRNLIATVVAVCLIGLSVGFAWLMQPPFDPETAKIPVVFFPRCDGEFKTILRNKNHKYEFDGEEVVYVDPGVYLAEFIPKNGGEHQFAMKKVPKFSEIDFNSLRYLENDTVFSFIPFFDKQGYFLKLILAGPYKLTDGQPPSIWIKKANGTKIDLSDRPMSYGYAASLTNGIRYRLPTSFELEEMGLSPEDYLFLEGAERTVQKKVKFVPRDGKVLSKINFNDFPD